MLVLAPLRVITTSWPKELEKWDFTEDMRGVLVHGGREVRRWAMGLKDEVDIYLMNVEGLHSSEWAPNKAGSINPFARQFLKDKKVMLVVDESTKFKNHDSGRFKILKKYLDKFEVRVILTGTPKPNKIEDLFTQCMITDLGRDLGRFVTHFRGDYMVTDSSGELRAQPGAFERLAEKIAPTTLNLEDDEAVPLEFVDYWVDLPPQAATHYKELAEEFLTSVDGVEIMTPNEGAKLIKLRQLCQGFLYSPEGPAFNIHGAKLDVLENLLEELNGDPLFCAYAFKEDIARISERLGYQVPHIGAGVSAALGAERVAAFSNGGLPLLLAHPQSAAHGIDGLQENCNKICWFGSDWSWENTYQLHKRIARHGTSASSVTVYRIMVDCGVEKAILASVERKKNDEGTFLAYLRAAIAEDLKKFTL